METGIQKAVRLAGSQTALANRLGITPQAVQKWVEQGYAPGERCRAIENEFDGAVTRYELNPEIFGEPPAAAAQLTPDPLPCNLPDDAAVRESKGGFRQVPDPTKEMT